MTGSERQFRHRSTKNQYGSCIADIENRRGPVDENYDGLIVELAEIRNRLGAEAVEEWWWNRCKAAHQTAQDKASAAFAKGLLLGGGLTVAILLGVLYWGR